MNKHTTEVYPDETWGSRTARETREKANNLTDVDREDLLRIAEDIINGRDPKAKRANRPRH